MKSFKRHNKRLLIMIAIVLLVLAQVLLMRKLTKDLGLTQPTMIKLSLTLNGKYTTMNMLVQKKENIPSIKD